MEKATSTISSRTSRSKEHALSATNRSSVCRLMEAVKPAFEMDTGVEGRASPTPGPWTARAEVQHGEAPSGFNVCPAAPAY